ncbi:MAG: ABC transporter permease [archaeon]|nr:ABC transporter permease [archaeon]
MFNVSLKNVFRNKVRTVLSVLGIVIGVAAIIVLVSIVDGLSADVEKAIGAVQGIRVVGSSGDPVFSRVDASLVDELDSFPGVQAVVPMIIGAPGLIDGKAFSYGSIRVVGLDFARQKRARSSGFSGELVEGSEIKPGDRGVAVIGKGLKESLDKFNGQSININNHKLKIIGVYSSGSDFLDSSIVVPLEDAREIFSFPVGKVSAFLLEARDVAETETIVKRLNFKYEGEIVALSTSDLSDQFGSIIGNFRLIVFFVAGISSIVAGVGIINTMLMSVVERFKEIGVLKAVGWTNSKIMHMIVLESIIISFFGGLSGIIFGFSVSSAIPVFFGLKTLVTPLLLFQVFAFAFLLGIIGGIYPAFVASKMDPVEALRFE